jgi:hypothetical protein
MDLVHQQAVPSSIRALLASISYFNKRKVDPVHVTGIRGTAPLILNLGTRWRQVQLHAPTALPLYLQKLGGHQNRSVRVE